MISHLRSNLIAWPWRRSLHIPVIIVLEVIIILFYSLFVKFDTEVTQEKFNTTIPLFTDVHVMVYIGIGFILTFLKNYSLSAVCINLVCGSFALQWYIPVSYTHLTLPTILLV